MMMSMCISWVRCAVWWFVVSTPMPILVLPLFITHPSPSVSFFNGRIVHGHQICQARCRCRCRCEYGITQMCLCVKSCENLCMHARLVFVLFLLCWLFCVGACVCVCVLSDSCLSRSACPVVPYLCLVAGSSSQQFDSAQLALILELEEREVTRTAAEQAIKETKFDGMQKSGPTQKEPAAHTPF
jgi:hypothetical protein